MREMMFIQDISSMCFSKLILRSEFCPGNCPKRYDISIPTGEEKRY